MNLISVRKPEELTIKGQVRWESPRSHAMIYLSIGLAGHVGRVVLARPYRFILLRLLFVPASGK